MLQGANNSVEPSGAGESGSTRPAMVVFVVAREALREKLRVAIGQLVAARFVVTETVLDAMLRVARVPADLVIIDLAHDSAYVPALLRHLARVDARTDVLMFDDIDVAEQRDLYDVLPWAQSDAALERWLERFRQSARR